MASAIRSTLSALRKTIPTSLLIVLLGVLVAGAVWLDLLNRVRTERADHIEFVRFENSSLARAFEEHVRRVVFTADNALLFVQNEFQRTNGVSESMLSFIERSVQDRILNQISLADAAGNLQLSALPMRKPTNVAHREHFQVHAASPDVGLYVGKPVQMMINGSWAFFLTRRLNRPDGSFAGIVSAGLDPAYFSGFYESLGLGADRGVLLIGRDGIVRARRFQNDVMIGQDLSSAPMFAKIPEATSGSYEAVSSIDHLPRFVSYRALPDFPLIVAVSSLTATAQAAYSRRTSVYRFAALIFTLVLAAFCLLLYRAALDARRHTEHLTHELAQRRKTEAALHESRELFAAFLDNIPAAVFVQDLQGRVLYANQTHRDLADHGAIGASARELLAPVPDGPVGGPPALRGRSVVVDETLVDGDGRTRIFETRMFAVERAGQEPLLGCIAVDSTARHGAEAERLSFERRMQQTQKLESLGVLAGGIAHDLNNLLLVILGNADLALTKSAPESPAHPFLMNIDTAAQRAADLANQMLAYSGKGRFLVEPVDLSLLVEEMGHLLASVISKRAVVSYQLAAGLPAVLADPTQIRQIVMNLITNASDALEGAEGTIRVATGLAPIGADDRARGVSGAVLPPGTYATVEVSDSGHGIDPSTLGRIFDPFYTTKQPGRGLGLAAVLGIVRGHRGDIRVASRPGQGTTFTVLLPTSPDQRPVAAVAAGKPSPPKPEPLPQPVGSAGRGTVLIVDDEAHVLSTARDMLGECGYQVVTAADGVEGVEVFRERWQHLAAVVLDMSMPRMGGAEAFRLMQSISPEVPVILSSGYDEQDTVGQFTGLGLAGFLQKPYRIKALLQKIEEAIATAPGRPA